MYFHLDVEELKKAEADEETAVEQVPQQEVAPPAAFDEVPHAANVAMATAGADPGFTGMVTPDSGFGGDAVASVGKSGWIYQKIQIYSLFALWIK